MANVIKTTVGVVVDAYSGIRAMNEEIRLGQDPAWKVLGVLRRIKPTVEDFEKRQMQLYKEAGGIQINNSMQIVLEPKGKDESDEAYAERKKAHMAKATELGEAMRALREQEVEIECEPLKPSMFNDPPNTPEDRKMKFNPNWLADAGPFLID